MEFKIKTESLPSIVTDALFVGVSALPAAFALALAVITISYTLVWIIWWDLTVSWSGRSLPDISLHLLQVFLKPGKLWVIPFVASLTYFAYYFQRYSRRHDRLRIDDQGIHLEERGDKPWSWHIAWKEIQLPIHIHMQSNVLYIQSKRPDNNPRQDERERKGILDRLFGSANTPENSVFILGHVSAWRQTDRKTAGTKTDKRPAVVHAIERYLGQNAVEKIRRFDLISKLRNQAEKTKNSRKDP